MGISAPPPASIDLVGSYARRRGADAELVLWAPTQAENAVTLVLSRAKVELEASVALVDDEQGKRLVCRVPRSRLTDGQWALTLATPDDDRHKVAGRLLVQGDRPLVLLWGGKASPSKTPKPASKLPVQKRVAKAGGTVLDSALKVLPADKAVSVRSSLRRTARKVVK